MNIDDDQRTYIWWDGEMTFDPSAATIAFELTGMGLAGQAYACSWQGAATGSGTAWKRTARTDSKFAGSATGINVGDSKPAAGRYQAQFIITTSDGQVVPATPFSLTVK